MSHAPFVWAAETHVGLHRSHNEDRYDVFSCPLGTVFIVCDGMGGHAAGDVAATIAIQKVKEILETATSDFPISYWLRRALFHAHYGIQMYAQQQYGVGGMGTTAVVLLMAPSGEAWWAHTGDSRLYLLREKVLHRLTHDHSYVSLLVDSGYITPEAAFGHPQSNQLLFTLGSSSYAVVDASTYPFRVRKGDIFLLCSDGVSGLIPDSHIAEKLEAKASLVDRTKALIHSALQAGGYDNATALTVEITSEPQNSSSSPKHSGKAIWVTIAVSVVALLIGFLLGQVVSLTDDKPPHNQSGQSGLRRDTALPSAMTKKDSLSGSTGHKPLSDTVSHSHSPTTANKARKP
ncbi:MAG: protein phosphatase 2C domain-containing protein [Bacteroidia bacterium]|nr:protein phosphatase 2C domain-containing protein [Bacteroidia bacterium]